MSKDYQLSVFIGRFQPLHNEHLNVIKHGLKLADKLLIIIGSSTSASTIKNPFSLALRTQMIRASLTNEESQRVEIRSVSDFFYSDNQWVAAIQNIVSEFATGEVTLIGSYKDSSSYYLNLFPQWDFSAMKAVKPMDATYIRSCLFDIENIVTVRNWKDKEIESYSLDGFYNDEFLDMVPKGVSDILRNSFFFSNEHRALVDEYTYIKGYKEMWETSPFPVTFVTADTVVVKSGHILLIKRKNGLGKDKYALAGGFIKQDETIETAAIRELKEETRIKVDKPVLRNNIKESKVFDYPQRSLRGRTITHAYFIDLGQGELPEVKANDDAAGAFWIPINQFFTMENVMFEDHFTIANYFLMRK